MYGPYFLIQKLAEGGMAEIFLAKRKDPGGAELNVVIKRMLPHLSELPDFVAMFLDEARLAARLEHENIIRIMELGQEEGCYYICMEFIAGEDFSTVLRTAAKQRQHVPLHVCCQVILDAAAGLHFAHEFKAEDGTPLNVVHRDVSPSNIYVGYDGHVKVLDFGIAKAESRMSPQTVVGIVKGKYMYMAPEQARGEVVDRRADLFALGVSLYEALTLTRPFARDSDLAIINAVIKNEFPPPSSLRPEIPGALERIVLRAMAGDLKQRYATAGEMVMDLTAFLGSMAPLSRTLVASYLGGLFGEERKLSKTHVPPLAVLLEPSEGPTAAAEPPPAGVLASRVPTSTPESSLEESLPSVSAAGERGWSRRHLGIVAGVALLAGAVWFGSDFFSSEELSRRVEVAILPKAEAERVVSMVHPGMRQCIINDAAELGASVREVTIDVVVATSGKVSAKTRLPYARSRLGQCLESQLERLQFPKQETRELHFPVRVPLLPSTR